jgi:hypothetical protein
MCDHLASSMDGDAGMPMIEVQMGALFVFIIAAITSSLAGAKSLSPLDLEGTWRLSAVASAKYGCNNPGAMTVVFVANGPGKLTGTYSSPSTPRTSHQNFTEYASMATIAMEHSVGGRAITLDSPGALRRILAVETGKGTDGRPERLEWRSAFGGFGEDDSVFTNYATTGWLTRCPS